MTKKEFINKLMEKRSRYIDRDQEEMAASLLDTVSSDIYSEGQRFVFELIQNADDSSIVETNEVHFQFYSGGVIVSHNGEAFTEEDIDALTSAGNSTKKNDSTKTGYKGIGFKSVFGMSNSVAIFSGGYQFRFDKSAFDKKCPWQIIPIWTDHEYLSSEARVVIDNSSYKVSTLIETGESTQLKEELLELISDGLLLLFLRSINKITVSSVNTEEFVIEKMTSGRNHCFEKVSLKLNGKIAESWIVKKYDHIEVPEETREALQKDDKTPDKLKNIKQTSLSFAARVEGGKVVPLKSKQSLIFTYLPTKVSEYDFPFLVNGSFLTNASREALHEDSYWNQWLFEKIAENSILWLAELADTKYKLYYLNLLPKRYKVPNHKIKQSFDSKLDEVINSIDFVLSEDNSTLNTPLKTVIDPFDLSNQDFIDSSVYIDYLNMTYSKKYDLSSFVHHSCENISALTQYDAFQFTFEYLKKLLSSKIFLENHDLESNIKLIQFFKDFEGQKKREDLIEKLKSFPFILDQNLQVKAPSEIFFPIFEMEVEFSEDFTLIHPDLFDKIEANTQLFEFLKILGVNTPSNQMYFKNMILKKIQGCIDQANYIEVTRFIFKMHKKGELSDADYKALSKLKIFTKDNRFISAEDCYLPDELQPTVALEKKAVEVHFVSLIYTSKSDMISEWKTFFLKIGVKESFSIISIVTKGKSNYSRVNPEYFSDFVLNCKEGHPHPHLINQTNTFNIKTISLIEEAVNYDFSKIFWPRVFMDIATADLPSKDSMHWGYYSSTETYESYLRWGLKKAKIFPSTTKECLSAKDLFLNKMVIKEFALGYLPILELDMMISEEWLELIPFKTSLKLKDYLEILSIISKQSTCSKDDEKTIGNIYLKIIRDELVSSDEKKCLFNEWLEVNVLLSDQKTFEKNHNLKWVSVKGFDFSDGVINTFKIPEGSKFEPHEVKALLDLFNIPTVNEFSLYSESLNDDESLKKKLEVVLPYFIAYVSRNDSISEANELYENISLRVNSLRVYSSSLIRVDIKDKGLLIKGPKVKAYIEGSTVYFQNKFNSPTTWYELAPKLYNLLDIKSSQKELDLIMSIDSEEEVLEWLQDKGVERSSIPERKPLKNNFSEATNNKLTQEVSVSESIVDELKSSEINTDILYPTKIGEVSENSSLLTSSELSKSTEQDEQDINGQFLAEVSAKDVSVKVPKKNPVKPSLKTSKKEYSIITNDKIKSEVGRWAEEYIYRYLSENSERYKGLVWQNRDGESGKPYDFSYFENGRKKYIGVKGTPSSNKSIVYLSLNEWCLMFDKGEDYEIFRVSNVGTEKVSLIIVEYPSHSIKHGRLLPSPIELYI